MKVKTQPKILATIGHVHLVEWTESELTPQLRWSGTKLEQLWLVQTKRSQSPTTLDPEVMSHSSEWRPVPDA